MFALQTRDLSHIEFEQSENISNLPQGKYIEFDIDEHIDNLRSHLQRIQSQETLIYRTR